MLRRLLAVATDIGFSAFILSTHRVDDSDLVQLDVRFKGRVPLRSLVPHLYAIDGVRTIHVQRDSDDDEDESRT